MKIAILDLGTNTFHLLIVRVEGNKVCETVFKSKMAVNLGEGGIQEGRIAEASFVRGIDALKHYSGVIRKHRPEKIYAFATSGIRSAANGRAFIAAAKREAGIKIEVIPGKKEAELICFGVRQCVKMGLEKQLIMDIGGGSTEFIIANDKKIFWKQSFNIGASRLLAEFNPSDPITGAEIKKVERYLSGILTPLDAATQKFPIRSLIGSSGSFDTFAEMIGWRFHGRNVLKNSCAYRFDLGEYFELHTVLLKSTLGNRLKMKGLVKMRVDMIVLASICTNFIIRKYHLEEMILSKYALKEGALWKIVSGMK